MVFKNPFRDFLLQPLAAFTPPLFPLGGSPGGTACFEEHLFFEKAVSCLA